MFFAMNRLFIPIIHGTGRPGNSSAQVVAFVHALAEEFGFNTQVIHPEEFATPVTANDGPEVEAWCDIVQRADGFIVVTPEYNHSYPGELKILMDKAYYEYNHKPVGMVGVSSGAIGGARVLESLLPVWNTYKLIPLRDGVYFTSIDSRFENGEPTKETRDDFTPRIQSMFRELQAYGEGMKSIREKLSQ